MLDFLIPTSIYLLGSSLCFIPLFSDELVSFKSSTISRVLLSQKGRDLSIASITLAVPICMGILTDVITSITIRDMSKKIRPHVGRELLSSLERFFMTVAILVVSLPAFLDGNTANFVNIWLCMRRSRLLLVAGAVQVSLCRYDEKYFSVKTSCLSLILMSIGSIMGVCGVNVIRFSTIPAIPAISGALILLGIVVFLRNCWKWLFFVTPKVLKWALQRSTSDPTTGNSIEKECCKHYVFPSILVASSATASIVMVFISSLYPVTNFDSDSVFYDNLGNIFFNLFTMYISDRMMKFELIDGLVSHNKSQLRNSFPILSFHPCLL
jgi:hypothetical protein